ncbi:MAG: hypothetical protein K8M05_35790 [Deltaproteobacteria bacterium]|nr:hypothetical protein [Kofleriaceae bacterium]
MTLRPPRAIAALLGLVAIVLGTVGVHRHVTTVEHGRCEHGAEVHLERVGGDADAAPMSEPGTGPVLAEPVWWESEGDHHCGAIAPIVCAAPELQATLLPAPAGDEYERPGSSRVAVATALYRLAPKTSPPISLV